MKIICVGRNYVDHALELHNDIPTEPVLFMKPKTALLLPGKPMYYPDFTNNLQYECELVVRICRNGKHIQERFARKYYDAVTLGIDFTARDVQDRLKEARLPWEIAKAFDGAAATGNFVLLKADMNINNLSFRLHQNGSPVQEGNTGYMIFPVDTLIAYASRFFSLNMGDLIFTGTPAGVGPVQVDDVLEGFLEEEKVLQVGIR